jgi:acyl carrier protein
MTAEGIRKTIVDLFRQRESMKNLEEDEDFFDMGVSSLTIIDLQIAVESALKMTLPTSSLMRLCTMRQWVEIYTRNAPETLLKAS